MNWKNLFPKENRYFETENGILYCGDNAKILKTFPKELIDLIITSPPYNVNLGNNKYNKNSYNLYQDNMEHKKYINWLFSLFKQAYTLIKKGGRVCINIGDGKNGKILTHVDLLSKLKQLYLVQGFIIWDKQQVGNRTAWGSFKSPSNVSYPTPFEYILLLAKETFKLQHKGITDLTKEEFITWAYSLWRFKPENQMKKYGHPAMFPVELPKRVIKMNTYINDLIMDIFSGAGTSLITAEKMKRRWIGIEIDEKYCEITKQRFEMITYE